MKLYLVRHGETEKNKYHLVQGQTEADLSQKGIDDAKELIPLINSLDLDVVISSPMRRAKETAEIITEKKYPINLDDRLMERNWGLCEGISIEEVDTVKCWNVFINTNDNFIEPVQDFIKRVSEFIEDIRERYADKKVLVVSHSAVMRAMHYAINGIPEDGDLSKIDIPNLRIMEYDI